MTKSGFQDVVVSALPGVYSIQFFDRRHEGLGATRLEGSIINLSAERLFDKNCFVALRNIRYKDGSEVQDNGIRAHCPRLHLTKTGNSTAFYFEFQSIRGIDYCEIDIVNEGKFWFHDKMGGEIRGFRPSDFYCPKTEIDWAEKLQNMSSLSAPKADLVETVLDRYDFSYYGEIRRLAHIIETEMPYEPLKPSSNRLQFSGRQLDALAAHFALLNYGGALDSQSADIHKTFAENFIHLANFFRGAPPPLPPSITKWLNGRAFAESISPSLATRSMVASLTCKKMSYAMLQQEDDLLWWFATQILIDNNLPICVTPMIVRYHFVKDGDSIASDAFPALSPFMERLYRDDVNYRQRYDITTQCGRCAFVFDILLLGLENESRRFFIGRDAFEWMTTSISDEIAVTPFEVLALANFSTSRSTVIAERAAEADLVLREHIDWLPPMASARDNALRIVGLFNSGTGLGVNARMSASAVKSIGHRLETIDAASGILTRGSIVDLGLERPIDLYHLNLQEVPALVLRYADHSRSNAVKIGFALWETSEMPQEHRAGAELLDELWVPTKFVFDVYQQAGFENIHVMGKGIDLGTVAAFNLSTVGLDSSTFNFLMAFDLASWVERKNPLAAVRAFQIAFGARKDVRLIIKTSGSLRGRPSRQIETIFAIAEQDTRIVFVSDFLSESQYFGLIAAVDAVISPHRAEGFGYLAAYSMLLAKPVIATDYSGTADFCNTTTGFPVKFKMIEADFVYNSTNSMWADIDLDDLAVNMLYVIDNRDLATERAMAGQSLIARKYSVNALAERYRNRIWQHQ